MSYASNYWQNRKAQLIAKLGSCCVLCGSKENLEIDHIDASLKTLNISSRLASTSSVVLKELQNCQLLCKVCHKEKTNSNKMSFKHGTYYAFQRMKCKCEICRKGKSKYKTNRNKRRNLRGW